MCSSAPPQRSRLARLFEDAHASWQIVLFPIATFRRVLPRNPILGPWLTVSALSMALTLPAVSVSQRAAAHLLEDRASPVQMREVERSLSRMKYVSVGAAPLTVLTRWGMTAVVLWAPAVLVSARVTFRRILSIVALAAIPEVLGKGVDLAVLWIEGPEFTTEMVPVLSSATSFAALVPPGAVDPWVGSALENLTLFSIWGMALWATGLHVGNAIRWRGSIAVAAGAGSFLLVLATAADVLGRSLLAATALPG